MRGETDLPRRSNTIVLSHRKDADGIGSAALIKSMTGAAVYLTDYADMMDTLSSIPAGGEVFVCDLGLNKNTFGDFLRELARLKASGPVHYIDHHPLEPDFMAELLRNGIDVYHSIEESAAMLVYKKYEERLNSPVAKIIACCGAITDYLDLQPFAKKIISSFDRQFLLYEATVLSFSIAIIGRDGTESNSTLTKIVEELASGKLPHQVEKDSTVAS